MQFYEVMNLLYEIYGTKELSESVYYNTLFKELDNRTIRQYCKDNKCSREATEDVKRMLKRMHNEMVDEL